VKRKVTVPVGRLGTRGLRTLSDWAAYTRGGSAVLAPAPRARTCLEQPEQGAVWTVPPPTSYVSRA